MFYVISTTCIVSSIDCLNWTVQYTVLSGLTWYGFSNGCAIANSSTIAITLSATQKTLGVAVANKYVKVI